MDKRYQIFLSSTYDDLKDERQKVIETLLSLGCIVSGMEIFTALDQNVFEYIKRVIDDCDYYLLIIGGRYGSISEDDSLSYTEKEYRYAVEKGKHVIAFLQDESAIVLIDKTDNDLIKKDKLSEFRKTVSTGRMVNYWKNINDLQLKIYKSLSNAFQIAPQTGWVRANIVANQDVLSEINELRKENFSAKKEINELKEKNINLPDDSLDLDGEIDMHAIFCNDESNNLYDTLSVRASWKEILSSLAPHMIDNVNLDNCCYHLRSLISMKISEQFGEMQIEVVSSNDVYTVFLGLKLSGLIIIDESSKSAPKGPYFRLSPKGEQVVFEQRLSTSCH